MSEKIFIENLEDYNFVFDSEEKENIISKVKIINGINIKKKIKC